MRGHSERTRHARKPLVWWRTRLACWFRRLAETSFSESSRTRDGFAHTRDACATQSSIPFVFFHRLGFSDARVAGLRPALLVSVFLINVLQDHRDHRGGDGPAMRFAANVAFI